jgi:hypothetical protein
MSAIFNTPGIGGLVAVIILGIFTVGYIFTLRWILDKEKEDQSYQKEQETGDHKIKQTLLRGVQGGGFLEKNPPGRRRQKGKK